MHTIYILLVCYLKSSQRLFITCYRLDLPEASIHKATIGSTVESPLVYAYQTKLTPHFEHPPKHVQEQALPSDEQPS